METITFTVAENWFRRYGDDEEVHSHLEFEIPRTLSDDVEALTHEFSETEILWWLNCESQTDVTLRMLTDDFDSHKVELGGADHPVAHMMVSMHLISGYNNRLITPEEYIQIIERGVTLLHLPKQANR